MGKTLSIDELRKMSPADLRKEVASQRQLVAGLHLTVKMGKEKGSHLLHQGKTLLARMLTVLQELQKKTPSPTLPTPKR